MGDSTSENEGFRQKLFQRLRLNRLRDNKPQDSSNSASVHLPQHASSSQCATLTASSLHLIEGSDIPKGSTITGSDEAQIQTDQVQFHQNSTDRLKFDGDIGSVIVYSDLWSAAYREAVESLREEIDIAALKGKDAAQLFRELEDVTKEVTHESVFLRGMRYLQTLKVPLERFQQALDLATPLAKFEPTAATVLGVVRGLTAVRYALSVPNSLAWGLLR